MQATQLRQAASLPQKFLRSCPPWHRAVACPCWLPEGWGCHHGSAAAPQCQYTRLDTPHARTKGHEPDTAKAAIHAIAMHRQISVRHTVGPLLAGAIRPMGSKGDGARLHTNGLQPAWSWKLGSAPCARSATTRSGLLLHNPPQREHTICELSACCHGLLLGCHLQR